MTVKIVDRDHGYKRLLKAVTDPRKLVVAVGVLGDKASKTYEDGVTVSDVASFHEFGIGVPERSFLRAWFDAHVEANKEFARRLARARLAGAIDVRRSLELMGARAVAGIQERIAQNIPPPLAPTTVARKGSSVALIDTGQLRSSITWRVQDKGAI